jgi:hypothetical protein
VAKNAAEDSTGETRLLIRNGAGLRVLRPALADRQGEALFIGTPQGFNHFHKLYESAEGRPDWKAFQFTTVQGGNVSPEEIESATHDLDERTFHQEFQAAFEHLGVGRAYYPFDRAQNVRKLNFQSGTQLAWALDFNMNPLCSLLLRIQRGRILVLEEMILPDSNTVAACEEVLSRTAKWHTGFPMNIHVYGVSDGRRAKDLGFAYRLADCQRLLRTPQRSFLR